jgi:hypothetical protein
VPDWIVPALLALNLLLLLWLAWLTSRPADQGWLRQLERLERELRDELGRQGQGARGDLAGFQQMLLTQSGDVARTQNEQIDSFRVQLATLQQQLAQGQSAAREALDAALHRQQQLQRPAPGRAAPERRAAPGGHPAGQRRQARADARHRRREAPRHARAAPGRELQAGGRAARAGAPRPRARCRPWRATWAR